MSKRIKEVMGLRKERGVQSAFEILENPYHLQNLEHNLDASPILRILEQVRFYVF